MTATDSALRGFTRITDTARPEEVIPLLNDYADAVVSSIHEARGDVLKLIGDGTLAIFKAAGPGVPCPRPGMLAHTPNPIRTNPTDITTIVTMAGMAERS